MKKIILLFVVATSFGVMAQAQDSSSHKKQRSENGRMEKKNLKDELGLSQEQSTKMKEINSGYKSKMQDIKNNETLSAEQKKEQLNTLQNERKTRLNATLSPEQQSKMEKMKKAGNHRKHKKERTPVR